MEHNHVLVDDDNRFIIDGDTRQITNLTDERPSVMQSDHHSETFVFQMPRFIEGHDMSLCDEVYITYKNVGRGTSVSTRPVITDRESITDLAVDETDENLIVFSWKVNDYATQYAGTLIFQFKFVCKGETAEDPSKFTWHTDQYSFIEVRPSLDISDDINDKYPRLLDEIDAELQGFEDKLDGRFLGLHIGPEPPTTGQVAWIDTDAEENSYGIIAKPGQVVRVKTVDIYGNPLTYEAVDLPKIPEPDLNANEGEEGHVKGRTHYIDKKGVIHKLPNMFLDLDWIPNTVVQEGNVVCPEREESFTSESIWYFDDSKHFVVDLGLEYTVYWNGMPYRCIATSYDEEPYLGNGNLRDSNIEDTGEPFCFSGSLGTNDRIVYVKKATSTAETVKFKVVHADTEEYEKMPERYLPEGVVKSVNGAKPDEKGNVQIEAGGGTGGSANIDVTATVGQTIIVKEVDENGKPTKWEAVDYQPRTHWTEFVELLPETTIPLEDGQLEIPNSPYAINVGETYRVTWNGEAFECEAKSFSGYGITMVYIGNEAILGLDDTGEPFIIAYISVANTAMIVSADGSTATVTIKIEGETVNPIPKKFIPPIDELLYEEVELLPLTELTVSDTGDGAVVAIDLVPLVANETYTVNWNGTSYTCVAVGIADGVAAIGNMGALDSSVSDSGEPFFIMGTTLDSETLVFALDGSTTVALSISYAKATKIPEACLPELPESSELPEITESDDGAILRVVNGEWTKAELPESSELPEITESDDGAILRVVNGKWAAVQLPRVEESEF